MPEGYFLDVDIFRLSTTGHPATVAAVRLRIAGVSLSSITVEEMLVGRLNLINRARSGRTPIRLSEAHAGLSEMLEDITPFRIHSYCAEAEQVFGTYPPSIRRIGPQDCRLAAHAMARNFAVVTRNVRHFDAIGIPCEDWSA